MNDPKPISDQELADRLRANIAAVREDENLLKRRGYAVSRRGKQVRITKTETKTTDL